MDEGFFIISFEINNLGVMKVSYMEIGALILMLPGFVVVYLAKIIVKKYGLNEKAVCDFKDELTEEELVEYKFNKAILKVKMMGMTILLPGLILFAIGIFMK